jgi:hypothetical protein
MESPLILHTLERFFLVLRLERDVGVITPTRLLSQPGSMGEEGVHASGKLFISNRYVYVHIAV